MTYWFSEYLQEPRTMTLKKLTFTDPSGLSMNSVNNGRRLATLSRGWRETAAIGIAITFKIAPYGIPVRINLLCESPPYLMIPIL